MLFVSCYLGVSLFSDPNADPNGSEQRKGLYRTGEDIAHCLRRFELGVGGHMGVGVQRKARGVVPEHTADGFDVHAILQCQGRECMPLRYNYDKPEKPRISRVFGYLARFFILFQTEKSSREVIIS